MMLWNMLSSKHIPSSLLLLKGDGSSWSCWKVPGYSATTIKLSHRIGNYQMWKPFLLVYNFLCSNAAFIRVSMTSFYPPWSAPPSWLQLQVSRFICCSWQEVRFITFLRLYSSSLFSDPTLSFPNYLNSSPPKPDPRGAAVKYQWNSYTTGLS